MTSVSAMCVLVTDLNDKDSGAKYCLTAVFDRALWMQVSWTDINQIFHSLQTFVALFFGCIW